MLYVGISKWGGSSPLTWLPLRYNYLAGSITFDLRNFIKNNNFVPKKRVIKFKHAHITLSKLSKFEDNYYFYCHPGISTLIVGRFHAKILDQSFIIQLVSLFIQLLLIFLVGHLRQKHKAILKETNVTIQRNKPEIAWACLNSDTKKNNTKTVTKSYNHAFSTRLTCQFLIILFLGLHPFILRIID